MLRRYLFICVCVLEEVGIADSQKVRKEKSTSSFFTGYDFVLCSLRVLLFNTWQSNLREPWVSWLVHRFRAFHSFPLGLSYWIFGEAFIVIVCGCSSYRRPKIVRMGWGSGTTLGSFLLPPITYLFQLGSTSWHFQKLPKIAPPAENQVSNTWACGGGHFILKP